MRRMLFEVVDPSSRYFVWVENRKKNHYYYEKKKYIPQCGITRVIYSKLGSPSPSALHSPQITAAVIISWCNRTEHADRARHTVKPTYIHVPRKQQIGKLATCCVLSYVHVYLQCMCAGGLRSVLLMQNLLHAQMNQGQSTSVCFPSYHR